MNPRDFSVNIRQQMKIRKKNIIYVGDSNNINNDSKNYILIQEYQKRKNVDG